MIPEMARGKCIGQMEAITKANGRMAFSMEEVTLYFI